VSDTPAAFSSEERDTGTGSPGQDRLASFCLQYITALPFSLSDRDHGSFCIECLEHLRSLESSISVSCLSSLNKACLSSLEKGRTLYFIIQGLSACKDVVMFYLLDHFSCIL